MKKNYFAFICSCMVLTCAMAGPQSGNRIFAADALSVEWDDATLRPIVDDTSYNIGWKICLTQSEDDNMLILSGVWDSFNIPIHVDYANGKAWIETGRPLDGYSDNVINGQFKRDVERVIYALSEQWLIDADADMCSNIYGMILNDGSIMFDSGFVLFVNESTSLQDLTSAQETSESVWMSSPLLRDVCLLVPNAIHQFSVENDPIKLETINSLEMDVPNTSLITLVGNCSISVASGAASDQNKDTSRKDHIHNIDVHVKNVIQGKRPPVKDPHSPQPKSTPNPGGNENVAVASSGTSGRQVSYTPVNGNDNPNNNFDLTSKKRKLVDPNNPSPRMPSPIDLITEMKERPSKFYSYMASNTQENHQFSEPVYVFQSPNDNTIMVYNLFGSGCLMNMNDCQMTPETLTWGITVLASGDITCYYDSNVISYTDGTTFVDSAAVGKPVEGDVNNDGNVNIADVTVLIDLLLTTGNDGAIEMNKVIADDNEDGNLNIADITSLIDMLLHNAD